MCGGRTLAQALSAYGRKFASEDTGHVVRSLVYFDDAEAEPMPEGLTEAHWAKIKKDLRAWVTALWRAPRSNDSSPPMSGGCYSGKMVPPPHRHTQFPASRPTPHISTHWCPTNAGPTPPPPSVAAGGVPA